MQSLSNVFKLRLLEIYFIAWSTNSVWRAKVVAKVHQLVCNIFLKFCKISQIFSEDRNNKIDPKDISIIIGLHK